MLFVLDSADGSGDLLPLLNLVVRLVFAYVAYRMVTRYARGEHRREEQLAEAARIEGATLATRTVRHHLANKLTATIGYSEMLADDPRLPEDLGEHAKRIRATAIAAAQSVDKLQQCIVRVELDTTVAGPALLDVDASVTPDPPTRSPVAATRIARRANVVDSARAHVCRFLQRKPFRRGVT
ncbi:MAG TPA: hypothetical protein VGL99_06755 [Chloroflexota bacterium]